MPKKIALAGHKGGIAKTSLTCGLAAVWASDGWRVLVVDLDPQASATRWLRADSDGGTVGDVLSSQAGITDVVVASTWDRVDVVPSSPVLASQAAALAPDAILALGMELETVEHDAVLVDCPPSLGLLALAGLYAVDVALVPVDPSGLAMDALRDSIAMVERVQGRRTGKPSLRVVISRVDPRQTIARSITAKLHRDLSGRVLNSTVRERVAWREAATLRRSIIEHDAGGAAADDIKTLAAELLEVG